MTSIWSDPPSEPQKISRFSWGCFNWFWTRARWTQNLSTYCFFFTPPINPWLMIKGSLSGAEDHRSSGFPGKAGIGKTPSMSKGKGKINKFCYRGASKETFRYLSFVISYQKKQRQSRREMLRGLRGSLGKHSSILPGTRMSTFLSPDDLAHELVGGCWDPLYCISKLAILNLVSFTDTFHFKGNKNLF